MSIAEDAFGKLGDFARNAGLRLALEANPADYGTNFLTTFSETAEMVARLSHSNVGLNFDIGAMKMTGEHAEAAALFMAERPRIFHVHISEPMLAPPCSDPSSLGQLSKTIREGGFTGWMSIEMRAAATDRLRILQDALQSCAGALSNGEQP
jgi:sugar phosphate isomerase/epimerase